MNRLKDLWKCRIKNGEIHGELKERTLGAREEERKEAKERQG